MTKFITPTILIVISFAIFFVFTNPIYDNIAQLRTVASSYNEALDNSKALENERDKLVQKYNSINPENLARLEKLLPDNINNIRLILEIEQIASPYGMVLKNVKYNATSEKDTAKKTTPETAGVVQGGTPTTTQSLRKDYGVWDLEFSTAGAYNNFINFTRDLESNLRIVDVSSIEFLSSTSVLSGSSPDSYKYNFKVKTYWLKN